MTIYRRWLLLLIFVPILSFGVTIKQAFMAANANGSYTFILRLSQFTAHKTFILSHPHRIVIDLDEAELKTKFSGLSLDHTPVLRIRSGNFTSNVYRIVLDVNGPMLVQTNWQTPNLMISFHKKGITASRVSSVIVQTKTSPLTLAVPTIIPPPPKIMLQKPQVSISYLQSKVFKVVIDPGHGGKDPGATGIKGTLEKDVVLSIAKKVKKILDQQPDYQVCLTRQTDRFLRLRTRLRIARQDKADLFVAIHADAYPGTVRSGSSVYTLSARGASSEAAKWLADKENYSELGGAKLTDKNTILRTVLLNLSQSMTIDSSLRLGKDMLEQLGKINNLHNMTVEQAGFIVLKSPDIPSVLVETGFLSNPMEEARLNNENYQQKLALAIALGIEKYKKI